MGASGQAASLARNGRSRTREPYEPAAHAQLAEVQRSRLLSAMFEVAAERGAANVTIAQVVERSGVSRRTFYEVFEDREACLLAAFEQALALASERVLPAYESADAWRERIRAALVALLCFLDGQPVIGRLLIVESLSGGAATLGRRRDAIARITSAVDEGRTQEKAAAPTPLAAEAVVGGALTVIHARMVEGAGGSLLALAGPLMSMLVLPYLGAAASRQELKRPTPKRQVGRDGGAEPLLSDPFKEAGMRLTYRTVRVLTATADHAGASNRTIGRSAGIDDQGQISKLLGRLQRIELIANTGGGPQGAPNAWSLTDRGRQVLHAIRSHTEGSKA